MALKSKVNLYLPSMRPIKEKLPLSMMVTIWAITFSVFGAIGGYLHYSYVDIAAALKQSTTELDVSKTELATLQTRHADFKPSPQLMTKLDRLTQELNGKRFLSQHLKGDSGPQSQNYSEVMRDLGRFHDDRLWLTKMRFDDQGVFLKGFAVDALAVPEWLNQLQQSEFFSGKSFALMNLKDDNRSMIAFEINTVAGETMDQDEKLAAIQDMMDEAKGQ